MTSPLLVKNISKKYGAFLALALVVLGGRLWVVHSISLPPGEYGGDDVERLFTNRLDTSAHPFYAGLQGLEVSAHFLVRRDGRTLQFVSCDERAWRAGACGSLGSTRSWPAVRQIRSATLVASSPASTAEPVARIFQTALPMASL